MHKLYLKTCFCLHVEDIHNMIREQMVEQNNMDMINWKLLSKVKENVGVQHRAIVVHMLEVL